jgi:hypothetical protein
MKIKNKARNTLVPEVIIGSILLGNEIGATKDIINPPPISIKIHMTKIKP